MNFNRAYVGTPTAGTGTLTLNSTPVSPQFCTFMEAGVPDGAVVSSYIIEEGTNFEIGIGVYTMGGLTLTRGTVRLSRINGVIGTTKMTLGGSATVRIIAAAEDIRQRVTADFACFVAPTGSDTLNNGMTVSTPFLTIQKAADTIINRIDPNGFVAYIFVADGTYTGTTTIKSALPGVNISIIIVGNATTPANCVISAAAGNCFNFSGYASVALSGFKLSGPGLGIFAYGGAQVSYSAMDFNACVTGHIQIDSYASVAMTAACTASSSAPFHIHMTSTAMFTGAGLLTLTGTPNWSNFFIGARGLSYAVMFGMSFSGASTGIRFLAHYGAPTIDCNGKSLTFLPGDVAGTVDGGGIYIYTAVLASYPQLDTSGRVIANAGLTSTLLPQSGYQLDVSAAGGAFITIIGVGAVLSANLTSEAAANYVICEIAEINAAGGVASYVMGNTGVAAGPLVGCFVAPTTTPAAGKASVMWDGATRYKLYSNITGTAIFKIILRKLN